MRICVRLRGRWCCPRWTGSLAGTAGGGSAVHEALVAFGVTYIVIVVIIQVHTSRCQRAEKGARGQDGAGRVVHIRERYCVGRGQKTEARGQGTEVKSLYKLGV